MSGEYNESGEVAISHDGSFVTVAVPSTRDAINRLGYVRTCKDVNESEMDPTNFVLGEIGKKEQEWRGMEDVPIFGLSPILSCFFIWKILVYKTSKGCFYKDFFTAIYVL